MSRFGWVSVLAGGLAVALIATSCSKTSKDSSPAVGGVDGAEGGAPTAGSAGSPSADAPLAGAPALLPPMANGLPWLGTRCKVPADCGEQGLRCLSANEDYVDGQGAPGGGLCTTDCTTDADCRAFDAHAVCATLAEEPFMLEFASKAVPRLCMQGCSLGAPSGSTKCQGRSDLACRPFAPDHPATCFQKDDVCPGGTFCFRGACRETACGPRCNANADCDSGRRCNPLSGLCDSEPPFGVPLGAACAAEGQPGPGCGGGRCTEVDDADGNAVKHMCTQSCTIGSVCGEGRGACVWARIPNYVVGDAGYCLQRCDCDGDCVHPADHCVAWGDAETERVYGSRGGCDYVPEGTPTLTCDDGQGGAGGAAGAGGAN